LKLAYLTSTFPQHNPTYPPLCLPLLRTQPCHCKLWQLQMLILIVLSSPCHYMAPNHLQNSSRVTALKSKPSWTTMSDSAHSIMLPLTRRWSPQSSNTAILVSEKSSKECLTFIPQTGPG
ncbi:hypothetical protein PISMIDRAFT_640864, partial [Pisolithus microcarpus 441]